MQFCITFNGRVFCFFVPVLIERWRIPRPDPGPLFNSDWIKSDLITARQAQDLSILATMHELAGQLSPTLQRTFEEPVKHAMGSFKLPEGASLSMAK